MKRTPKCHICKKPVKSAIRESKLTCDEFLAKNIPYLCSEGCKVEWEKVPFFIRALRNSFRVTKEVIGWRVILDDKRVHKAKLRAISVRRRRWRV